MKSQSRSLVAVVAVLLVASLGMGIALATVFLVNGTGDSAGRPAATPTTSSSPASTTVPVRDLSNESLTTLFGPVASTWTKTGTEQVTKLPAGITSTDAYRTDYKDAAGRTLAVLLLRVGSESAGDAAVTAYLSSIPNVGARRTSATTASQAASGTSGSTVEAGAGVVRNGVCALFLISSPKAVTDAEIDTLVGSQDATLLFG